MADINDKNWQDIAQGRVPNLEELARWAMRPVSHEEFYHLLEQTAHLDIAKSAGGYKPIKGRMPKVQKSAAGWLIHDYSDRILASPGELMFGGYRTKEDDDESGGGYGTVVGQMMVTVRDLMDLIRNRWPEGAVILDGFYGMKRAAWIVAQLEEYQLSGFEPSPEDRVIQQWVQKICPGSVSRTPKP